jgi:7-keto-8-aminopelargonate synthetase-like enzyme
MLRKTFVDGDDRYGVALSIKEAYATGVIGEAFDCADNSGSIS